MRRIHTLDILSIAAALAVTLATLPPRNAPAPVAAPAIGQPAQIAPATLNPSADAPRYQAIDLGLPKGDTFFVAGSASANSRYVVGYAGRQTNDELVWRPVVWQGGTFHNLSGDNTREEVTLVSGINDAGTTVGRVILNRRNQYAVIWKNGKPTRLFPSGDEGSAAFGIDAAGNIFGSRYDPKGETWRAFIRGADGSLTYFKDKAGQSSMCYAANNQKQFLVTYWDQDSEFVKVGIWDKDGVRELPPLETDQGSFPIAINDRGLTVGGCFTEESIIPVGWRKGKPIALPVPANEAGLATGINNAGDTVGMLIPKGKRTVVPFLLQRGSYYNINELVENKTDIEYVEHIGDDGTILAGGYTDDYPHTFLLQPK